MSCSSEKSKTPQTSSPPPGKNPKEGTLSNKWNGEPIRGIWDASTLRATSLIEPAVGDPSQLNAYLLADGEIKGVFSLPREQLVSFSNSAATHYANSDAKGTYASAYLGSTPIPLPPLPAPPIPKSTNPAVLRLAAEQAHAALTTATAAVRADLASEPAA